MIVALLLIRTDELTGLYNRRHVEGLLEQESLRHARSGAPLSIALLDLDHFKALNDSHGHPFGDQCLRALHALRLGCRTHRPNLGLEFGLLGELIPHGYRLRRIDLAGIARDRLVHRRNSVTTRLDLILDRALHGGGGRLGNLAFGQRISNGSHLRDVEQ